MYNQSLQDKIKCLESDNRGLTLRIETAVELNFNDGITSFENHICDLKEERERVSNEITALLELV